MILAQWTYTKEEWKAFLQSTRKGNSLFGGLLHFLLSKIRKTAPVVRITPEMIWIGNDQQYFSSGRHTLTTVTIAEAGSVNIMAIRYAIKDGRPGSGHEIKIPVPKGKLKEAIEVEKKLNLRIGFLS